MSIGTSELIVDEEGGSAGVVAVVPGEVTARSPAQLFWRRFRADRVAVISGGFLLLLVLVTVLAPLFVSILGLPGPDVNNSNALDAFGAPTGPTGSHPFGVDQLGRDILSRVIYGARISLEVGILGTALAALVGTVVGLFAGFYRGWVDTLLMRAVDVFLSFPVLVLGLGIGAACGVRGCGLIQPGLVTVVFIIALSSFTYIARIVRGQVLSLREKEFIEAARSLGASNRRIVFREVLPNLVAPLIVYSSLLIPQNILLEAALSYLGVGIRPPTASWGQMIADAQNQGLANSWWYVTFPGAALLITVFAFNLVGDGLLDAFNPRGRK